MHGTPNRVDDVTFADTGPLQNPLVSRIDHLLEVRIGQHVRRNVGGERTDRGGPPRAARTAQRRVRPVGSYHSRESFPGASSPK